MSSSLPPGVSRFLVRPHPGSTGFLSKILMAKRKNDPGLYILKVGTENQERRKWAGNLRMFERELAAYRLLAPLRGKLSPRFFSGTAVDRGSDGLLLLEYIRKGRSRDQLQGLTWPELTLATRTIARLHAHFWNSAVLKKSFNLPRHHYMRAHEVRHHLPSFLLWARLPVKAARIFRILPQRVSEALAHFRKRPVTLIHGDFRCDNLLFERGAVKVIDWAFASQGAGVFDVARLAGGSSRRALTLPQHFVLLKIWHSELLRQGVRAYPIQEAWRDYRNAVILTLTIPVTNAPTLASFSPRGRRMAKLITQRFLFSARELGLG